MNRKIGLVFSYGVMITEILSAMFVTPFIIRSLGQAEYGIYQLTSSITAYLIIFDLGVGNSVIRYMAKFRANNDRESQRKFLGVTTVYYAAVTLVILIVGVLLITVFPNVFSKGLTSSEIVKAKELLSITIVTSAISIGTSAFSNTLVAYERFTAHKGIMILANIAKMAVLVFLMKMGVKILGTSAENVDAAEDRELFDEILEQCEIPRPKGHTVFTAEEAKKAANELGYPVLVRPSYVLGGQGMQIAISDEDVDEFIGIINRIAQEHPILVDKYLQGKEIEVDAVCDGTDILIPGIMEHIERAGVHSGDSISVYPAQSISQHAKDTIVEYTKRLARSRSEERRVGKECRSRWSPYH